MGGTPLPSGLDGGTPPPVRTGWGYPPPPSELDEGIPPPTHPCQETEQQSQYLLRGGRYASCVHAGGLSCLIYILFLLFSQKRKSSSCASAADSPAISSRSNGSAVVKEMPSQKRKRFTTSDQSSIHSRIIFI